MSIHQRATREFIRSVNAAPETTDEDTERAALAVRIEAIVAEVDELFPEDAEVPENAFDDVQDVTGASVGDDLDRGPDRGPDWYASARGNTNAAEKR